MDFTYLYNPDNGICGPYNEQVAAARSDLVPLLADELKLIKTMSILDIIARREANSAPTASVVVVETNNESPKEEIAPMPVPGAPTPMPSPKGVSVEGKMKAEKPIETDVFGSAKVDYTQFYGYYAPIFPLDQFDKVPDEDLVRFAAETMHRKYDGPTEDMTDDEKDILYKSLREKIRKNLIKDAKKKVRRVQDKAIVEQVRAADAANKGAN